MVVLVLSLWVFSTENLKCSPEEISGTLAAIEAKIAALADHPLTHQQHIRVPAIGRLDVLPPSVVAAIRAAEAATASHDFMTLTIAAAYGGCEEITDAVHALLSEQGAQGASLPEIIEHITPGTIARYLYTADLPIQTSSSERVVRSAYPAFCFGRAPTASSTLRTSCGQFSGRSTFCAPFVLFRIETVVLDSSAEGCARPSKCCPRNSPGGAKPGSASS